jgi:hypothetical protein
VNSWMPLLRLPICFWLNSMACWHNCCTSSACSGFATSVLLQAICLALLALTAAETSRCPRWGLLLLLLRMHAEERSWFEDNMATDQLECQCAKCAKCFGLCFRHCSGGSCRSVASFERL